jgi:DNA repair protein RadC
VPIAQAAVIRSIKSLAVHERPREKMLAKGQAGLSNRELLQVVIGSGIRGADVTAIADEILTLLERYHGKLTMEQLVSIRGVSLATASKLLASLELVGRFNYTGRKIETEDDVLPLLEDIRHKQQEHFVVITLDGANRLIEKRVVTIGTLNASLVHPREVFADAITDRAAGIVVAHNHPGGSLQASGPDIVVTKRLRAAGELLGIKLLDHLIVTRNSHSLVEVD